MRAPFSFLFSGRLACLALLVPPLALAQNPPPLALADAAAPAAPTAPLHHQNIATRPLQAEQLGAQDWRAANAGVSDFPRGHADIVVWEAAQEATANPVKTGVPEAPSQHGGSAAVHSHPAPGAHPNAMHPLPPLKDQP